MYVMPSFHDNISPYLRSMVPSLLSLYMARSHCVKMMCSRRRFLSYFAYMSLVVFLSVLLTLVLMDKSSTGVVIFDGPELRHAYNVKTVTVVTTVETSQLIPKPNFATPNVSPHLFVPRKHRFNCAKLINNDFFEMTRAKNYMISNNYNFTRRDDGIFQIITQNCDMFKTIRGYPTSPVSTIEREFPIAFNILMHHNVEQLERLLRTIYTPQNQYCIHVDKKAPPDVIKSVRSIASCFENVFVASRLETVVYASYTRLQADINCMKDHINRKTRWKYLINMAASEFPIQSNFQLVQILTLYNGANDIHETFTGIDATRFKQKYVTHFDGDSGFILKTNVLKPDPPYNLTIAKGNAYNVFSRSFAEFVLENKMATDLLEWSIDTYTPDEHYWATLNNLYSNPFLNTPGGYKGNPETKPYFGRYIGWNNPASSSRCRAKRYIHNICVFSVEDLPLLTQRGALIANKFDIDYDPIVVSCLEEWMFNKTRDHVGIDKNEIKYYKKINKDAYLV